MEAADRPAVGVQLTMDSGIPGDLEEYENSVTGSRRFLAFDDPGGFRSNLHNVREQT